MTTQNNNPSLEELEELINSVDTGTDSETEESLEDLLDNPINGVSKASENPVSGNVNGSDTQEKPMSQVEMVLAKRAELQRQLAESETELKLASVDDTVVNLLNSALDEESETYSESLAEVISKLVAGHNFQIKYTPENGFSFGNYIASRVAGTSTKTNDNKLVKSLSKNGITAEIIYMHGGRKISWLKNTLPLLKEKFPNETFPESMSQVKLPEWSEQNGFEVTY